MGIFMKFLFYCVLLIAATDSFEMDYEEKADEQIRQFIQDKNINVKEFIRKEMQKLLANLSESFEQRLTSLESNVQSSFRNFSVPFGEQLRHSDLKITEELKTLNQTLLLDYQQLSHTISNFRPSLDPEPTLTEVEEVNAAQGTIYFPGGTNLHLRRKIWVFQSEGGDSYREMSFVMQKMRLGDTARLSLWASGLQNEWKGYDWGKERNGSGNVFLVTLTILPGTVKHPSFKLKFNTTSISEEYECWTEVLRRGGRQVVSFPSNNEENFPPKCFFVAVVAPPHGRTFELSLKYLDIPGTPPNCANNFFSAWVLADSAPGEHYQLLPVSVFNQCGRPGDVSQSIGNASVAILWFYNRNGPVGKGFRVEAV